MTSSTAIDQRLQALGITLPSPPSPIANYVPYTLAGDLVTISGQIPLQGGQLLHPGRLGAGIGIAEGQAAARVCLLNLLAQLRAACGGDLGRVKRVLRLGGFIAATAEFTEHAQVRNGASDLIVDILGDMARHARSTVGVASLPAGAAVEIEGSFLIG